MVQNSSLVWHGIGNTHWRKCCCMTEHTVWHSCPGTGFVPPFSPFEIVNYMSNICWICSSLEEVTRYIYLCITKPSIHQANGLLHCTSSEAATDDTRGDKNRLQGVTSDGLTSKSTVQLLSVGPSSHGALGRAFPAWQTRAAGRWKAHIRCWQPPSRAA